MKLLTKEIESRFRKHPIGSQDGKGDEALVLVKYFNPNGAGTWLVTEAEKQDNGDWLLYGKVNIQYGWEWGYFLLSELQNFVGWLGLGIERELYTSKKNRVYDLI